MDVEEIGSKSMHWIHQWVGGSCEHDKKQSGSIKFWEFLE
jgi:hypothetical protein